MAASCRTSPGCFGDHTYIMPYTDTIVGSRSGLHCHTNTVAVAAAPVGSRLGVRFHARVEIDPGKT